MPARLRERDAGAAVVDFVLVTVLVLFLFLVVLQVGLAMHARNVLIASAAEGARFAANADRTPADGVERSRQVVRSAFSAEVADAMSIDAQPVQREGLPVVRVTISGPLPTVLPIDRLRVTVQGHAVEESQ